jgi:hypothetical protein
MLTLFLGVKGTMGEPQLDTLNWHTDLQVTIGINDTNFRNSVQSVQCPIP